MIKNILVSLLACFAFASASAQNANVLNRDAFFKANAAGIEATTAFKVDTITNLQEVANILLGPGINLLNVSYVGDTFSIATFVDTTATFGIDSGIVISTGSVENISGPNISGGTSTAFGMPGDTDLNALIPGYTTWDAVVLEITFIPLTDTLIATEMIFGSEEYPEYANSVFNDIFGFFLSGPGYNKTNVALIPGTSTPISINNVNHLTNTSFYVNNTNGQLVEFDGYTTPLPLIFPVQVGSVYNLKIAIADAGDQVFDSGIFLKKSSLIGFAKQPVANFTTSLNGLELTAVNNSQNARSCEWDFGDGTTLIDSGMSVVQHTYNQTGQYSVRMVAHNFYKTDTMDSPVSIISIGTNERNESLFSLQNEGNHSYVLQCSSTREAHITITDVQGKVVRKLSKTDGQNSLRIIAENETSGIYFIEIRQQHSREVFKIFF